MKLVALVPMRHTSERVPGKNYRVLGDRPLYAHILDTLLSCPEITLVVVDTDSPAIIEGLANRYGEAVTVLTRPEHLRADTIPMNAVLLHDVERVPADIYLQTHATNPLLRSSTVTRAIQAFTTANAHDALFGVTRLQTRLFDADGQALNHDPALLLRTQDLPPVYEENSNLYIFSGETIRATGTRLGTHPMMFEIAAEEAWDIDTEVDFQIAECLWRAREDPA